VEALTLHAPTADDTRAIGRALAPLLRARDAVALTGELGAGKTTFVQGVAEGLGVDDAVSSPTFVLVKEYVGRLTIAHADVYRLERVQDVVDLGLDEIADGEAVLIVEWGDVVEELLPNDRLRVALTGEDPTGADESRRVVVEAVGPGWGGRSEGLATALAPWKAPS
jgi:tRNA threonylcarbamoyladenosine biosynthesis protein TsaE